MIEKDHIIRQIQEFGRALARMAEQLEEGDGTAAQDTADGAIAATINLTAWQLMQMNEDETRKLVASRPEMLAQGWSILAGMLENWGDAAETQTEQTKARLAWTAAIRVEKAVELLSSGVYSPYRAERIQRLLDKLND